MSHTRPSQHTLYVRAGDQYRPATFADLTRALRDELAPRFRPGRILASPEQVRSYLTAQLVEREHEVFCMIALDARHRVIAYRELFRGSIDGSSVHPCEVVKAALKHNAAAVLFAHNHPSGVADPSEADRHMTRRLQDETAGCSGIKRPEQDSSCSAMDK